MTLASAIAKINPGLSKKTYPGDVLAANHLQLFEQVVKLMKGYLSTILTTEEEIENELKKKVAALRVPEMVIELVVLLGSVVSVMAYNPDDHQGGMRDTVVYLYEIHVAEMMQRNGIGQALIDECKRVAKKQKAPLLLSAVEKNVAYYEQKHAFEREDDDGDLITLRWSGGAKRKKPAQASDPTSKRAKSKKVDPWGVLSNRTEPVGAPAPSFSVALLEHVFVSHTLYSNADARRGRK